MLVFWGHYALQNLSILIRNFCLSSTILLWIWHFTVIVASCHNGGWRANCIISKDMLFLNVRLQLIPHKYTCTLWMVSRFDIAASQRNIWMHVIHNDRQWGAYIYHLTPTMFKPSVPDGVPILQEWKEKKCFSSVIITLWPIYIHLRGKFIIQ